MGRGILFAVVAGLLIGAQTAVLGRSAAAAPPLAVSVLVHAGGAITSLVLLSVSSGSSTVGDLGVALRSGWWMPASVSSAVILAILAVASRDAGVGTTIVVTFGAQLVIGLGIDAVTGDAPIDLPRLAGAGLVLAGAALVVPR
jgi:uncharacterized membrane protein YdcZ (DUF606 family)